MEFALIFPIAPVLIAVIVILFIVGAGLSIGIENAAEVLMNNADTVFWWCLVAGVIVAALIQTFEVIMSSDYDDSPIVGIFLYTIPKAIALTGGFFYLIFGIVGLFSQWHWLLFFFIILILLVFLLMALIHIVAPMLILTLIDWLTNMRIWCKAKNIIYAIGLVISIGLSIWYAWYTCAPGLSGDFSFYS